MVCGVHLPLVAKFRHPDPSASSGRPAKNPGYRLIGLAPHLPAVLWTEAERAEALDAALAGARVIGDEGERAAALVSLIRQLPGSAQPARSLASGLLNQASVRPRVLQELGTALPEHLKAKALQAVLAIASEPERGRALVGLAPHLPAALQAEALHRVADFQRESVRTETLTGLFAYLPDDLKQQAFDLIRTVRYDDQRSRALMAIAPHLPWSEDRARALVELAPYLADPERFEALALAWTIPEPGPRAWALSALISRLTPVERDRLARDIWPDVDRIAAEPYWARALANLVSSLPEDGKSQALRDILTHLRRKEPRAACLLPLLPHLPADLKGEAVASCAASRVRLIGPGVDAPGSLSGRRPEGRCAARCMAGWASPGRRIPAPGDRVGCPGTSA